MASLKRMVNRFLDERYDMETARALRRQAGAQAAAAEHRLAARARQRLARAVLNQVVTGILLLLYYRPTPEEAYKSIQYLHAT